MSVTLPDGEYAIVELYGRMFVTGRISGVFHYGIQMVEIEAVFRDELLPPIRQTPASIYRVTPCSREQALDAQAPTLEHLPSPLHYVMRPDLYNQAAADAAEVRRAATCVPESVAHAMLTEQEPF